MTYILLVIVVVLVILNVKQNKRKYPVDNSYTYNEKTAEQNHYERPDYGSCYQAKYLLTRNEWYEYRKLKEYADAKGLQVCPKVRLLDIVEPRHGRNDYKALMAKIKSKHVDFVICTQDLRIKAVLELDDSSHDQAGRQERDQFVDEVLTSCGYKVIHTRSITEDTLNGL